MRHSCEGPAGAARELEQQQQPRVGTPKSERERGVLDHDFKEENIYIYTIYMHDIRDVKICDIGYIYIYISMHNIFSGIV